MACLDAVKSPEDVQTLIKFGDANRQTGKTDWNELSSRSHAIITIVRSLN